MPTTPLFHVTLPPDTDGPAHFAPLQITLEGLCKINEWHLKRRWRQVEKGEATEMFPPLYESGVRYQEDPPGKEDWKDIPAVLADGHGDCDRLAAWRTAELPDRRDPGGPRDQIPVGACRIHGAHRVPAQRNPGQRHLARPLLRPVAGRPDRGSIQAPGHGR